MPRKYSDLKKGKEDCIYRAFENVTDEPKERMGDRVNASSYDADDSRGVVVLADVYGLDIFEAFLAVDYIASNYGLEKDKGYILICTRDIRISRVVRAWNDPKGMLSPSEARRLLEDKAYDSVSWHAIYAKTDKEGNAVFKDPQNLFPKGPNGQSIAVAICASVGD